MKIQTLTSIKSACCKIIMLLLVVFISFQPADAEEMADLSLFVQDNKPLSFHLNDYSTVLLLKKIAQIAKINLKIEIPDSDLINLNVDKTPVVDILKIISDTGKITFTIDHGLLKATKTLTETIENGSTTSQVLQINYSDAKTLSDTLNKSLSSLTGYNNISFDGRTNSIVLVGSQNFIEAGQNLITKLDVPRRHQVFKLNNISADDATTFLLDKIFNDAHLNDYAQASNDDFVGNVIKAHIEKNDIVSIYGVRPVVISEPGSNQILVIGNNYQISLAQDVISQLESDKSSSGMSEPVSKTWDVEFNSAVKEQIDTANKKIAQQTTQIQSLQLKLQQKNNEIVSLKQQLDNGKIPVKTTDEAIKRELTDLKNKLMVANQQITFLKENEKLLSHQKDKIIHFENQLKELRTKNNDLESNTKTQEDLIKNLKNASLNYETQLQESQLLASTLSVKNEELLSKIQEKQDSIAILEKEINDSKTNIMKKRIVKKLKDQLKENEQDLIKVKNQLNNIFDKNIYENALTISTKSGWFN